MSVQVEKLENNTAKLTIEVSAQDFDKAMQAAYLKQKKDISVPGFRKGKVPRQMIEKMFGPEVFYEDAADIALQENYPKAADESGLKILSRPSVEITRIKKGEPFIFTALVAVYPEFELSGHIGVEVPICDREVTNEEVEKEINDELGKNSRLVTVEDRPAKMGDICLIDYEGKVDGKTFEGGSGKDYSLELGSNTFIPGFEEQLEGVSLGGEKDVCVTFPDNYHSDDLKGKEAVFHCKINRIQFKEVPELDDEFAQDVSEFDTLEEYREDVKKQLAEKKDEEADISRSNAALSALVEKTRIDLPDILINERAENIFNDYAGRFQSQGMSMDQYLKIMGQTEKEAVDSLKPQALNQLKASFILDKVAEIENIEPSEEQMDEELGKMAKSYGMELDKLKEILSGEYMEQFKEDEKRRLAGEFLGTTAVETEAATKAAEEKAAAAAADAVKQAAGGDSQKTDEEVKSEGSEE